VNKLMSQALRCKLRRDMAQHDALTAQAAALREQMNQAQAQEQARNKEQREQQRQERTARSGEKADREHVVVIDQLDKHGRMRHISRPKTQDEKDAENRPKPSFQRKRKPDDKIGADGERRAFFDDDNEKMDLRTMIERERLMEDDYDETFAQAIANNKSFKDNDTDAAYDEMENNLGSYQQKGKHKTKEQKAERDRQRAIAETQRFNSQLDRCEFCLSGKPSRSLIVAVGVKMYLALPALRRVTPGHCLLVPQEHATAATEFDENVYEEYMYFRKHLVKMFAAESPPRGCVFMETVTHVKKRRHTVIECVPVPLELIRDAHVVFKKEILDADVEWSVNKKLIDAREKGFRRSVPKGFPYFNVEFDTDIGGYAHVIEDEDKFPAHFGKEVLCGLLEEPAQFVMRAKRQSADEERQRLAAFVKQWGPYDWTKKLQAARK